MKYPYQNHARVPINSSTADAEALAYGPAGISRIAHFLDYAGVL